MLVQFKIVLLRLEAAITSELQCSAVLRDGPDDVIGSALRNLGFDFKSDAHR